MYKTINEHDFINWFTQSDTYKDNFSINGLRALFEYIRECEEGMGGEPLEFDPIALCCEYSEYTSAWDAMYAYQPEDMPVEGEEGDDLVEIQEKNEAAALEWLQGKTEVITFDGGVIIRQF